MQSKGQTVLFVGDLSYADRYQYHDVGVRWDSWGRFVEKSAAYQPWIWCAGNHEIEYFAYMVNMTASCFSIFFSDDILEKAKSLVNKGRHSSTSQSYYNTGTGLLHI